MKLTNYELKLLNLSLNHCAEIYFDSALNHSSNGRFDLAEKCFDVHDECRQLLKKIKEEYKNENHD